MRTILPNVLGSLVEASSPGTKVLDGDEDTVPRVMRGLVSTRASNETRTSPMTPEEFPLQSVVGCGSLRCSSLCITTAAFPGVE